VGGARPRALADRRRCSMAATPTVHAILAPHLNTFIAYVPFVYLPTVSVLAAPGLASRSYAGSSKGQRESAIRAAALAPLCKPHARRGPTPVTHALCRENRAMLGEIATAAQVRVASQRHQQPCFRCHARRPSPWMAGGAGRSRRSSACIQHEAAALPSGLEIAATTTAIKYASGVSPAAGGFQRSVQRSRRRSSLPPPPPKSCALSPRWHTGSSG
jgi:hypothetical protein